MIINQLLFGTSHQGYIAGTGDGIVTITSAKTPTSRNVILLDAKTLAVVQYTTSLLSGRYMFTGLDPSKQYLVICRDLPPNGVDQRYEPVAWDYLTPATDLTVAEQQELRQQWAEEDYQLRLRLQKQR